MGVMANREASWEEAQYYFEKGLGILANLDIDTDDTILTPEAVKYSRMLDNFVADYRTTLRSMGHLDADVSSSVLVERFTNMEEDLGRDTIRVFKEAEHPDVTYDLPVVMNERVRSSIVYFQTVAREAFTRYLARIGRYTPMMKRILAEYGMPQDLIYLSLVESGYNTGAYSWARAMGLWQFISSTGKLYGLERDWWVDERKDPIKSTHAACRFLKNLYTEFGSWELAMAAYNGGPGRVRKSIEKQKTSDFWKLNLRRQTMDYVPLIYAAAIIAKDPEKYGFGGIEYEPEIVWDEVSIERCVDLRVVANELGCSLEDLAALNPELLRKFTPPNTRGYTLKVPRGTREKFLAAYERIPTAQETNWARHQIRNGETIGSIAAKYGVSQYAIMEANNLRPGATIYAGKELIVPVPVDRDYSAGRQRSYESSEGIYVVRAGDTMWDIARAFGTSVEALRRINFIERGTRIYVGEKIKLPPTAANYASEETAPAAVESTAGAPSPSSYVVADDQPVKGPAQHTVKSGDTIWDIARKYGTTTAKIRKLNGLGRSSRIHPGQQLVVGEGDSVEYVIHQVRKGETLTRIAQQYRVSLSRIMSTNGLEDPDDLQVGANLKIYLR